MGTRIMTKNHKEIINEIISTQNENGILTCRERNDLEFKESFGANSFIKYAKTMAAFANNKGGYLLFGIKDKPREVKGVNKAFDNFEQEKLTSYLNEYYSPEISWESGVVDVDVPEGNTIIKIGYIYTEEIQIKPVVAIKNCSDNKITINSGDIFYRYRAQSAKIRFPELKKIMDDRAHQERKSLIKVFEAIRDSNSLNIGIIDYDKSIITTPYDVDIAVERKAVKNILKNAKYIREGSFKDIGAQPVLKITGVISCDSNNNIETQYPFFQKDLQKDLELNQNEAQALFWHYKIKSNPKYHINIRTSKSGSVNRYSNEAITFLRHELDNAQPSKDEWLKLIKDKFNKTRKNPKCK